MKTTSESEDRLLDVNEAARMLGVKPKTVYDWAYQRRIPSVKLFDKSLRFRLSTIQKLIANERPAIQPLQDPVD